MSHTIRNGLTFLVVSFLLTSCVLFEPDRGRGGTCRMLKSDIIFNGATSNDRQYTIQNSEAALQEHMYEKDCT